jgi:hypothetical protein
MKFARRVRYVRATAVSGVLAAFVPSAVDAADQKLIGDQQLHDRPAVHSYVAR